MKKKNQRKSNLKASLILLLLTAVLLITSSYAWFTSNQTVTVSSLQVNVEAKNGLQISADGTTWKSIIQTADLTGVHATTYTNSVNQLPAVLEPVSTVGNVTTGKLDMYYATVGTNDDGDYTITADQTVETEGNGESSTGKFIAFDLFFKVEKDQDIYISTNSGVTYADTKSKGMENAARVAFLDEGTAAISASTATIQALNGATNDSIYMWEPNYDSHTAEAITAAKDTYNLTVANEDSKVQPYSGIKAAISSEDNVTMISTTKTHTAAFADFFADVTPDYTTKTGFTANQQIFSLTAGVTKIRVYMWIEGQDVDCENNASGSNIKYDLQITTKADNT